MSTILGPLPCQACRQLVHVVRRTVEVPCSECNTCTAYGGVYPTHNPRHRHTHAIPDVAWTVVDANGERHFCKAAAA